MDHPAGLGMRVTAAEGLRVVGEFEVSTLHQGAPGLAHGGLLTAAFDEVLGNLNWLLGDPVVTVRIETDFRRPVPVGALLRIEAEVTGVLGRKVYTAAVGRLASQRGIADGEVAVAAAALFLRVPIEHFVAHGNPEQIAEAIADRAAGGPAWRAGDHDFEVNV